MAKAGLASTHLDTEVLVVGGGPAGFAAALAARRLGCDVLLVERYGILGGNLTVSLVGPMMGFHAGSRQVVKGIADEIVRRLQEEGASPGHVPDPLDYCYTITPFDYEAMKQLLIRMARENELKVWLHTQVISAEAQDGTVTTVQVLQRQGMQLLRAKVVVDASGDGEVAYRAGFPVEVGRKSDGRPQPLTMLFRLLEVDWETTMDYFETHPEELQHGQEIHGPIDPHRLRSLPCRGFSAFARLVRAAKMRGELDLPRERLLVFEGVRPGEAIVNTTRVNGLSATDGVELSEAEFEARRQVDELVRLFQQEVPGFARSYLAATPAQIGIRESRRVVGEYMLSEEDILQARKFPDAIAACAYPIDIHDPASGRNITQRLPRGEFFTIPYRALVPRGSKNLLVAGRCFSATHEALASARISAVSMAIGQAAGVAAALAAQGNLFVNEVPYGALQEQLREQDAFIPADF